MQSGRVLTAAIVWSSSLKFKVMRKLSVMEMEHVQGGRELDGGAIAIAALSVAYLKNIYNTGRACDLF
jgi:hypothetical protein